MESLDPSGVSVGSKTREPSSPNKAWALLVLILLSGFGLRAWYGSWYLHPNRFWDEKYALKNVQSHLVTGNLAPANGYYPSPVWFVPLSSVAGLSETLYSRTGNTKYRVLDDNYLWTPTGILLCRLMQAVYGTLAILFVFLAGRRIFGTRVALLAAAMVAFAPWPIHSSGYIKPDALLLMTLTMSFWASVAAVDKPTFRRHVLAGVAIALALSSKLTGGIIAVSLVVAALVLGRRERRRIVLLAVAGVTSATVFVALNPYWASYLHFLEGLKKDYILRAEASASTRLKLPSQVIGFITGEYLHGLVIGAIALIGFGLLAASVFRRRDTSHFREDGNGGKSAGLWTVAVGLGRAKRAMFIAFPLAYTSVYILQTPYFKANNFQPFVLFSALSAAWLLTHGGSAAVARWRLSQRSWVSKGVIVALTLWLVIPGWNYVYRSLTPTTRNLAITHLSEQLRRPASARLVYAETWDEPNPPWGRQDEGLHAGLSAIREAPSLIKFSAAELGSGDGSYFLERHLKGDEGEFYRQLKVGGPTTPQVKLFKAEPFKARGPNLVVITNRWKLRKGYRDIDAQPCEARAATCRSLNLPGDLAPQDMASLFLLLSWDNLALSAETPRLEVGEQTLSLSVASKQPNGMLYVSPRFRIGEDPRQIRLVRNDAFGRGDMLIQLARWHPEWIDPADR